MSLRSPLIVLLLLVPLAAAALPGIDTAALPHWSGSLNLSADSFDVEVAGSTAYVLVQGGLVVYDIADPDAPVELGSVFGIGYGGRDLVVDGSMVYAVGNVWMTVIDVSVPATPVVRGDYLTQGLLAGGEMVDGFLYLFGGDDLTVLDVSDPDLPAAVYSDDDTPLERPEVWGAFVVVGNLGVHAGTEMGYFDVGPGSYTWEPTSDLRIYDLTTPSAPALVGSYDLGWPSTVGAMTVVDGIPLLSVGPLLYDVDLTTPASPTLGGHTDVVGSSALITDMILRGDQLWFATSYDGLGAVDVTVPTAPIDLGRFSCPGDDLRIADLGDRFWVATDAPDLAVFDLGAGDGSASIANLGTSVSSPNGAFLVATEGDLGFFVDGTGLLTTLDLTPSGLPLGEGSVQLGQVMPYMAEYSGDVGLVSGFFTMYVVDLSDLSAPVLAASQSVAPGVFALSAVFDGDIAYVGTNANQVLVLDLSDPYAPVVLSTINVGSYASPMVAIVGGRLYVQVNTDVYIYGIGDPSAPVEITVVPVEISGQLAVDGVTVCVAGDGLRVLDATDPNAPVIVGRLDLLGHSMPMSCVLDGPMLYVEDDKVIQVIDLIDPTEPVIVGAYQGAVTSFGRVGVDILASSDGDVFLLPMDHRYAHTNGVDDDVPASPVVMSAAPNPFNPAVRIAYRIVADGSAVVTVHDLRGRLVATLFEGVAVAGLHDTVWRGVADDGRSVVSGTYVVRVRSAGGTATRKVTLLQ